MHLENVGTTIYHSVVRRQSTLFLPLSWNPSSGTIFLILLPQPSWLWILVDFHLQTLHRPGLFIIHLLVSYTLIFMIFSSLLVCLIRDPGPSTVPSTSESVTGEGEDIGLRAALLSDDDDFTSPNKWCRKCWVCGTTSNFHPIQIMFFAGTQTRKSSSLFHLW